MLFGSKRCKLSSKEQAVLDEMVVLRDLCFLMRFANMVQVYSFDTYESRINPNGFEHKEELWYYVDLNGAICYRDMANRVKTCIQNGTHNADEVDKNFYQMFFESYTDFLKFKDLTSYQVVDLVFDYLHEDPSDEYHMMLSFPFIDSHPCMMKTNNPHALLQAFEKATQEKTRLSSEERKQLQDKYARPTVGCKVAFVCPSCRANLHIPAHTGKTEITCPRCKHRFVVNNQ